MKDIGEMLDEEVRKIDERKEMLLWLTALKPAAVVVAIISAIFFVLFGFIYGLSNEELSTRSYLYVDQMVKEQPAIKSEVSKFLDDGKITRAEYSKIRRLHKRAVVSHMRTGQ